MVAFSQIVHAFDCSKASEFPDTVICKNEDLKAADDKMSQAYATLSRTLDADQRKQLLTSQRQFLQGRQNICQGDFGPGDSAETRKCIEDETLARYRLLAGVGENGPVPGVPRLVPRWFEQKDIGICYPVIDPAGSEAEKALNAAMKHAAFDIAEQFVGKPPDPDNPFAYDAYYDPRLVSPRLVSLEFNSMTDMGGAHPSSATYALNYDLAHNRALKIDDVIKPGSDGVKQLGAFCAKQLVDTNEKGLDHVDPDAASGVVGNINDWAIRPDGVRIFFPQYSVAAYSFGIMECDVRYDELKRFLPANSPVPPH